MTGMGQTNYDEVPYVSHVHPSVHPDRLATLGVLHGMTPAPVDRCRVLELGCGDGTNVIALGYSLPNSEFLGVDLAASAIARGRGTVTSLELGNVRLDCRDILDLPADAGPFDYVIAHGLYSWVPPAVRDGALRICSEQLTPNGIAYVSYNCFPGGHIRQMIRQMLLEHLHGVANPVERIREAREFVRFLLAAVGQESPEPDLYRHELEQFASAGDHTILHDDLAEVNDPVYFHEFMEHAGRHQLQFLADADFFSMQPDRLPEEVKSAIQSIPGGDVVRRQQYLDFARTRMFRKTLLCHAAIGLTRPPDAGVLERMYIAADLRAAPEGPGHNADGAEEFQTAGGLKVQVREPLVKSAFSALAECWPLARPVVELAEAARSCVAIEQDSPLPPTSEADPRRQLQEVLLQAFGVKVVELHTVPSPFVAVAGERPRASRLARLMAASAQHVSTLSHRTMQLEGTAIRTLMGLCDGTRTREELRRAMAQLDDETPDLSADGLELGLLTLARMGAMEA